MPKAKLLQKSTRNLIGQEIGFINGLRVQNQANLEQYTDKGAESIINFLINDWKAFGRPDFYNLITKASFRGSLYHVKTFGKLSRFYLKFGVEIVFIPFKEPWRNGYIENFNKRFNDLLWRSKQFKNLRELRVESKKFREKHNNYQESVSSG